MPSEVTKILELNENQKSDKEPFIIYADLECIMHYIKDWYCKKMLKIHLQPK